MNDEDVRRLLHDAVDDLRPEERLTEIRARAHGERGSGRYRRYAVTAVAAAATAAVVGTVVWAGGAFVPNPTESTAPPAEGTSAATPSAAPHRFTAAIYWLGQTPQGVRLYREFQDVAGATQLEAAVDAAISGTPDDPDYRAPWPGTQLVSARVDRGLIRVDLDEAPTAADAVSPAEGSQALEQVIRTAQAAVGRRLPVQFQVDGNPVAEVFGQPTAEPLAEGEWSEVLALVSLSDPAEGAVVTGEVLTVTGVASSFEATVPWRVLRDGVAVRRGIFTATGWVDRLHPFRGTIDVSGLAPGRYLLEVSTSDPSGGAEGAAPFRDTRGFEVR